MFNVFLTGATGLIGGQVLHDLVQSHPNFNITALIRNTSATSKVIEQFPSVRVVEGGLDDEELVEQEASKANVILHLGSNKHMKSMRAILHGLQKRKESAPVYWVQVSGASALASPDLNNPNFQPGSASDVTYDDVSSIAELNALVRDYPARAVDNFMLDVADKESSSIKTALVWPCIVYGVGEGPCKTWSAQIPTLSSVALQRGHAVRVGQGLNRWGTVHVQDLGKLILLLAEAAFKHDISDNLWGSNGIYLTGAEEISFGEIADRISLAGRNLKLFESDEVESLTKENADKVITGGTVFYGTNCRGMGNRARKFLDWKPSQGSMKDDIPRALQEEATRRH